MDPSSPEFLRDGIVVFENLTLEFDPHFSFSCRTDFAEGYRWTHNPVELCVFGMTLVTHTCIRIQTCHSGIREDATKTHRDSVHFSFSAKF